MKERLFKVLAGLAALLLSAVIGWVIGHADKCFDDYQAGIADSKKAVEAAIKDGVPFHFGGAFIVPEAAEKRSTAWGGITPKKKGGAQ
jgi:hypothetical protein